MAVDCSAIANTGIVLPWRNVDRIFTILSVIWLAGIVSRDDLAKITIFYKTSLCSSSWYFGQDIAFLHLSSCCENCE